MQAAIDRVLRTFALKHPVSLHQPMSDERPGTGRHDEATAFAAELLNNYKDRLARRGLTRD